ncbi:MAG: tetratricopeptide repeat protein, partial [Chitinophagaceae bacterium]
DSSGAIVRRYSSDDSVEPLVEGRNTPDYWIRPHRPLSSAAGLHRFVWDVHHERPAIGNFSYPISAIYYYQLGKLHRKTGEYDKALVYFTKAQQTAGQIGQLEQMSHVAAQLDSLYRLKGDYKQALYYSSLNYQYKDSLDKLGKEKDLMQIEVADEQQRQERLEKEKLEIKRKRDNIQYLLITIGIAGLFIILVMMGMFKVSATTIKMIGFFTFLMFFEFIFLILKKNIYGITKGEPWKDLLFMILLAAVLLPLHHWLEHKVIHYLTSHNRLTTSGKGLMDKVLRRKKTPAK